MTRRLLITAISLLAALAVNAQEQLTDSVAIRERYRTVNDYSMLGITYGVNLSDMSFNPIRNSELVLNPVNVGITYTRYGKLFGYMPYFGFQAGFHFSREGYRFKDPKDETEYTDNILGAYKATIQTFEVPVMAHLHYDFWKMRLMANVGIYGGYRWKIHREYKEYMSESTRKYSDSFHQNENRWDYGIKAGAGIAFVFDPIEIHLMGFYKYSWSTMHQPDVNARTLEHDDMSKYYYRWNYPTNIIIQIGIHYQLTKRTGRTKAALRHDAREEVLRMLKEAKEAEEAENEENEEDNGEGR